MSSAKARSSRLVNDFYTLGEEIANGITHGIGALLAIAALVILVVMGAIRGDAWHVVSFSIYGSSLIILFLASTLYHSIQHPKAKPFLRRFDHASIYLLIAGTYTPFTLISLRGAWGWSIFGVVWGLALAGIIFKMFFIGRFEVLSTVAYVGMGWICVIAYRQMIDSLTTAGLSWLIAGGVVYTVGVLFYAMRKIPYGHAIWHLFVLGGSICHFFAIHTLVPVS